MTDTSTRRSSRTPVTLKIKFKSETLAQFIERYSVDVSRGGIFIRTKDPLAVGTPLSFEFQLQDASPLVAGDGTVVWVREHDPSRQGVAPGMGVRFDKLTPESQQVLEKILSEKERQDGGRKAAAAGRGRLQTDDEPTVVRPAPSQLMASDSPTVVAQVPEALRNASASDGPSNKVSVDMNAQSSTPGLGVPLSPSPMSAQAQAEAGVAARTLMGIGVVTPEMLRGLSSALGKEGGAPVGSSGLAPPSRTGSMSSGSGLPLSTIETTPASDLTPPPMEKTQPPRSSMDAPVPVPMLEPVPKMPPRKDATPIGERPITTRSVPPPSSAMREPTPKSGATLWILAGLLVVAAGGAGWYFFLGPGAGPSKPADPNLAVVAKDPNAAADPNKADPNAAAADPNAKPDSNAVAAVDANAAPAPADANAAPAPADANAAPADANAADPNAGKPEGKGAAPNPDAKMVDVKFDTQPPGATVNLDGEDRPGATPVSLSLEEGRKYQVKLTLAGHKAWAKELAAAKGRGVVAKLEKIARVLKIVTTPVGAWVSVDGRPRGKTPIEVGGLDFTREHKLQFRMKGYKTHDQSVSPKEGWNLVGEKEVLEVTVTLEAGPEGASAEAPRPRVRPRAVPKADPPPPKAEPKADPIPRDPPPPKADPPPPKADPPPVKADPPPPKADPPPPKADPAPPKAAPEKPKGKEEGGGLKTPSWGDN